MPARVSLGIVAMLIVLTNYLTLTRTLPPGGGSLTTDLPWLVRLCLGSFYWTLIALLLLVLSSFGLQMRLWLEEKKRKLLLADWQQVLLRERDAFMQLVEEWDTDGSGSVTKLEFRKGVAALGVHAPRDEVNALFEQLDVDKDGAIGFDELDKKLFLERDTGHAATPARGVGQVGAAAPAAAAAAAATTASASAQKDDSLSNIVVEGAAGGQELGKRSDADAPAATAPAAATSRAVHFGATPRSSLVQGVAQGACQVSRILEVENAAAVRVQGLTRQTSRMRLAMRHEMRKDLGKSWWWSFKTFKLFPCLALLENIDIPARFIFPICYALFLVPMLLEVHADVADVRRLGGAEDPGPIPAAVD